MEWWPHGGALVYTGLVLVSSTSRPRACSGHCSGQCQWCWRWAGLPGLGCWGCPSPVNHRPTPTLNPETPSRYEVLGVMPPIGLRGHITSVRVIGVPAQCGASEYLFRVCTRRKNSISTNITTCVFAGLPHPGTLPHVWAKASKMRAQTGTWPPGHLSKQAPLFLVANLPRRSDLIIIITIMYRLRWSHRKHFGILLVLVLQVLCSSIRSSTTIRTPYS